ncbi:MAG: ABC transporter ATP-binding protein [Comamonas sp.]
MLDVRNIAVRYGKHEALHGVSLQVQPGELVVMLGANGAGKSSLLKALGGMIRPEAGASAQLAGKELMQLPSHAIVQSGLALVPEGRGVFPNLSVKENLLMSARAGLDGQTNWTYERVLETFPRLKERLANGGNQLSGGEQQMVSIGRALMTNPRLLILDEATEGLAPLVVAEIWRVIAQIRQTGISTLIVDRDYKKVLAHTDHVVVMEKGRLALQAESAQLQARPEQLSTLLGV